MHFRIVCLIKLVSAVRFGFGFTHDAFNFCTSHVHTFFHTYILSFLSYSELVLCFYSFFLSLSQIEPPYGTQTAQIYSGSEPSSWFRVILF